MYVIGEKVRADKLGMKGRQYLQYLQCKNCNENRFVRPNYTENFICTTCVKKSTIKGKNLNSFKHRDNCKCHKCRIGKGYFKGKNNPMWKGGVKILKTGYVYVYIEETSPFYSMVAKGVGPGYVAEHRLVMSKFIGRPLLKNETVHHKNGIKSDNRIENLELWSSNHQSGQRLEDQIIWAIKLLEENNYTITKNNQL
jgi:hypothetical protein